jgi:hypothetical protein
METEAIQAPNGPAPRTSTLMRIGVALFALGMLAVVAVFIMFAAGIENLPIWLSAAAGVITPLGLGLGLIALVREARQKS